MIVSLDEDSPGLAVVRKRGVPIVLDYQPAQSGTASVNIDDREGAAAAFTHLIDLGHTAIATVAVAAGPEECAQVSPDASSQSYVVRERMTGWRQAATAAGLDPPMPISCPVNSADHGRHAARLLLDLDPSPTAIACLSDEQALGAVAGLAAHGVGVPVDVSVMGFDDSPHAAQAFPPLTIARQPARDKGALAASLLIEHLRTREPDANRSPPTDRTGGPVQHGRDLRHDIEGSTPCWPYASLNTADRTC